MAAIAKKSGVGDRDRARWFLMSLKRPKTELPVENMCRRWYNWQSSEPQIPSFKTLRAYVKFAEDHKWLNTLAPPAGTKELIQCLMGFRPTRDKLAELQDEVEKCSKAVKRHQQRLADARMSLRNARAKLARHKQKT